MSYRLQHRRDTQKRWLEINPVLMEGEVGYEIDTHHQKVGDGIHRYSELDYTIGVGNISQDTGNSETLVMSQKSVTENLDFIKVESNFIKNLFNPNDPDVVIGYYLGIDNNEVINKPKDNYLITGYIPFNKAMGNLIASVNGKALVDTGGCLVLYDENKNYINHFIENTVSGVATWQEGVAYVRFSMENYKQGNLQVEVGNRVSVYVPYGEKLLKNHHNSRIVNSISGEPSMQLEIPTLSENEMVIMSEFPYFIKKGLCLSFCCDINTFNEILIGKGFEKYRGRWLSIDENKISLYYYEGSKKELDSHNHGLIIKDFVKIILSVNDLGEMSVVLQSKTGMYVCEFYNCYEMNYEVFVKSVNSSLNNCTISATNKDFRHPVWAIGDSYFGVTNERWIGVMKNIGYFNFLINGLSGQQVSGAWDDLQRMLLFGQPKYLLWFLGMNGDYSAFEKYFEFIKNLCIESGITLILSTIPNVPERDKKDFINLVYESGFRYVDFSKAVGSDENGNWINGYLSSDGVHPTALGAQALATQVLIDFPEIMGYGKINQYSSVLLSKDEFESLNKKEEHVIYYVYEEDE